jgi:soluble lytic murein transglycosylase-like protein
MNFTLTAVCAGVILTAALPQTLALADDGPLSFLLQEQARAAKSPAEARLPGRRSSAGRAVRASGESLGNASADVGRLADQLGVPRALALNVCRVESRCRYGLTGQQGVKGPMQIKLATARGLGYSGSAQGLLGYQGAYYGVKHLAVAMQKCRSWAGAATLHQAGLAASCRSSAYSRKVLASI